MLEDKKFVQIMLHIKIKLIKIKIWDLQVEVRKQIYNMNLTLKFDYKNLNKLSVARKLLDFLRYFMMPRDNHDVNIFDWNK